MKLLSVLTINKGEKISIVGAGGKTTLMFALAEELKKRGRVLITTTTKIYLPTPNQYDCLILKDRFKDNKKEESNHRVNKKRVYLYYENMNENKREDNKVNVYGSSINEENKVLGVNDKDIYDVLDEYDYMLIEADGSKKKPLKGWREDEPVISNFTSMTIGVLSGEVFKLKVEEKNIHRVEEFLRLTGETMGCTMTEKGVLAIIFKEKGLFKNSKGRKVLFINKMERENLINMKEILKAILIKNKEVKLIDKIIIGSLFDRTYRVIDEDFMTEF